MPKPFRFDRSWRFDVPVEVLWDGFADTSAYPLIWTWLDDFEASALTTGGAATFRVRPPLPYSLRFTVTLDDVVEHEHVYATVGGDVRGPARLVVSPTAEGGAQATITWRLELQRPMLRGLDIVARPAMILGHDVVMAMGVRQFKRKVLKPS